MTMLLRSACDPKQTLLEHALIGIGDLTRGTSCPDDQQLYRYTMRLLEYLDVAGKNWR